MKENRGSSRPAAALLGAVLAVMLSVGAHGDGKADESRDGTQPWVKVQPGLVAATLEGEPIPRDELNSPELVKARRRVYELEKMALRAKVMEQLRRDHPREFAVGEISVSDQEIRAFYKEAGLQSRGTLEAFKGRIQEYLTHNKTQELEDLLFQKAIGEGYVTSYLMPPPAFLIPIQRVEREGSSIGPKNAPIQIIEFSDFQCPFCDRARVALRALRKKYGNKLRLVYRHLPLDNIHPFATPAAEAAECAAEQGRFWRFHDLIFEDPSDLTPEKLQMLAKRAGVPRLRRFQRCVEKRKYEMLVKEDAKAATALGMTGTPAFIIARITSETMMEGELLSGARPLEDFVTIVEQLLDSR